MFKTLKILAVLPVMLFSYNAQADLAIIGHPDYDAGDLDLQSVKRLFLGERKSFPSGYNATPMNHAVGSPDRKEFFSTVLNMAESSHKRHWKHKQSIGAGSSPSELESHDAVLHTIASTPGSISYIDPSLVDDSVKVLLTVSDFDGV